MRVLLVEDEEKLAEATKYILEKQGYAVDWVQDGISGQDMAETGLYDAIILDRMLPKKDGVEVLRYLRNHGIKTPVIFVTARDAVADRVEGLDAGGDDYLVKPFSKDELLARLRALARRPEELLSEQLRVAKLTLDALRCEADSPCGTVKLSSKETQLLELLMRHRNQVLRKEQIFDRVWGPASEAELSAVELYIFYLRKKIDFPACGVILETIRGIGYCMKEAEE